MCGVSFLPAKFLNTTYQGHGVAERSQASLGIPCVTSHDARGEAALQLVWRRRNIILLVASMQEEPPMRVQKMAEAWWGVNAMIALWW